MDKTAVIFGATGQDGSYLSSLLLDKDYEVIAVSRRASTDNTERLSDVKEDPCFSLVEGDILDPSSVNTIIKEFEPDEVYNLAAQSHVGTSFRQPAFTFQVNAVGVLNCLEAIRTLSPDSKFYQASTSELFGSNFTEKPNYKNEIEYLKLPINEKTIKVQNEKTAFAPRSPYAVAKMAAHQLCYTYRESYGIFASCGILFNHESEKRGLNFVTRKVTNYVSGLIARRWREMGMAGWRTQTYGLGEVEQLGLGNLDARRDWGHAEDYVRAMWLMLQQDEPDDFVVATGKTYSIRDLLDESFGYVGITDWSEYVYEDPQFLRPADVEYLCGDATKAKNVLGWEPQVSFKQLVHRMVDYDYAKRQESA